MADDSFLFGGGGSKKRPAKKAVPKKEDKEAFLARTQANRNARQQTKQEEVSSMRISAFFRRMQDMSARRREIEYELDADISGAATPDATWEQAAGMVRRLCFVTSSADSAGWGRISKCVERLLPCFSDGASVEGGYVRMGLSGENRAVFELQAKRLASLVVAVLHSKRWTLSDPSNRDDATLLRSIFILTDSSLWKDTPKAVVPQAVAHCAGVLRHLVLSKSLLASLRDVMLPSTASSPHAAAAAAASAAPNTQLSTLFATLALRPLSQCTGSHVTDSDIAYLFCREVLSIPHITSVLPSLLLPSLLHPTVWPRTVFSMGSAARAERHAKASQQQASEGASTRRGAIPGIPADRVLPLLGNLVELSESSAGKRDGMQLIFMSAVDQLLINLPTGSLAGGGGGQLTPMCRPALIHWLLRGCGGAAPDDEHGIIHKYSEWSEALKAIKSGGAGGKPMFTEAVHTMCRVYSRLLKALSANTVAILNALAFDSPMHVCTWVWLQKSGTLQGYVNHGAFADVVPDVLYIMCKTYMHRLMVTDDTEFYVDQVPFPLPQLVDVALSTRQYVNRRFWGSESGAVASAGGGAQIEDRQLHREAATALMHQLYDRNARREFCPLDTWLQKGFKMDAFGINSKAEDSQTLVVLREFPHVIALEERCRILQKLIAEDKGQINFPDTHVKIRRSHIIPDGFAKLGVYREQLKGNVKVHFVNESGLDESGIDMGGLYKEFITAFIERAFSPDYGLFRYNTKKELYPNPASATAVNGHLDYFAFLGRMLGKAMYDGIQMDVPFCGFFVAKLLGKHNYLDQLPSLDPDLHKNLIFIKNYEGDVSDLCLDFTATSEEFGGGGVAELIPGGKNIEVTNANRIQYIHLMADYRLNKSIKKQCEAFLKGFQDIVPVEWIRFFNPVELQIIISGERNGDFDVEDLKKHTQYSGGYSSSDSVIKKFWKVVGDMSPQHKCLLLKFVTSCPRPPLLGFANLQPPFVIHKVRSHRSLLETFTRKEEARLPSASTCMNLLKLPEYLHTATLRDKLTYAISSSSGFELS